MRPHDLSFVLAIVLTTAAGAAAQEAVFEIAPSTGGAQRVIMTPDGKPMVISGGQRIPAGAMPARPGRPTPPKAGDDKTKKKAAGGDDEKKKDKAEESKVLTRPDKPPMPANPDEFKVKPNGDGLIRFSFRYQTWPDVLDWVALVSGMSLDWQELPKDYLNLTTQRDYNVVEMRDLINRHLLARGFTLLEDGEDLQVVAIAKLNPAMVPRFRADDLSQLAAEQPYKFVKVSFGLDWLLADQAAEEFKPMLSPNGKLVPLKNTNRLEGMDAAINLHEINTLLNQEQSNTGESPLVEEFVLTNARAADVLTELQTLLGLESKKAAPIAMSSSQMRAMQQQQQMMAQQMAAQRGGKAAASAAKKEASVNLVVNKRKNSILAHAPPDKMAIIAQAIEALDVRSDRIDSLLAKPNQMEIYRLNNLDPTALAKTLEDLGDLEPNTHLDVDEKNNALIVYGSLVDQATIRQLVQRLDGNSRKFEVIRLRRLAADYVAGTVEFMMLGEEEKQTQPRYYDFYSSRYGSQRDANKNQDKFRVDADIQNNMLLLWANELEIESVMQLLVKLGEMPPQGGNPDKVRVLTTIAPEDAAEFLEKLRRAWPSLSPNKLNLPDLPQPQPEVPPVRERDQPAAPLPSASKEARATSGNLDRHLLDVALFSPDDSATAPEPSSPATASPAAPMATTPQATNQSAVDPAQPPATASPLPARNDTPESAPAPTEPTNEELLRRFFADREKQPANTTPPPIDLSIAPDGSLVISSEDIKALDVLEELVRQTAPALPDYKIYKLKYADAYWVMDNIEKFFKEDEDEKNNGFGGFMFFDYPRQNESKSRSRLSERRKLKFIYDLDTNSILVQGADSRQLKTIEELIEVYDQPEPTNTASARVSTAFPIQYSKASIIAATIKDVYRDLLSSNDKALQSNNPEKKSRESRETTYIFNDGEEPDRTQVRFKGKLSIGIDEITNTLVVSAEGENLMNNLSTMIKTLDEAAKPLANVSIIELKGRANAARVREVLATMLTEGRSAPRGPSGKNGAAAAAAAQNGQNRQPGQGPKNSPAAGATFSISPN